MKVKTKQKQFIQNLLGKVPKAYIEGYQFWKQEDWLAIYNQQTSLQFDFGYFYGTYPQVEADCCIWDDTNTHAFKLYHFAKDFSDIDFLDDSEIFGGTNVDFIDCFIGVDFNLPLEKAKYVLALKLTRSCFLQLGIYYFLNELEPEFKNYLEGWCLAKSIEDWLYFELGFENYVYSNFTIPSLEYNSYPEVAYNRIKISFVEDLVEYLTPIRLKVKPTYSIASQLSEVMQQLRDQYVKTIVSPKEYDELSSAIYQIVEALQKIVLRYGSIPVDLRVHYYDRIIGTYQTVESCLLRQYIAYELKSWHTTFSDPMTLYNDPYDKCNTIASELEHEWFWTEKYKITQ